MQHRAFDREFKWNKIIALILVGFFLAIAGGLAVCSGSHSLTHTYDVGKVCDVRTVGYPIGLTARTDDNSFWAVSEQVAGEWRYL